MADKDLDLRLRAAFATVGSAWRLHEHPAVFNVEESLDLHARLPGIHTKNLFLKDANGRYFLVSVRAHAAVDLKALPAVIGSKRLSFGKADDMLRLLGVTPGAVTPLAAVNDAAREVSFIVEDLVGTADTVNVHPLRNTATISLSGADLIATMSILGRPPLVIALPGG